MLMIIGGILLAVAGIFGLIVLINAFKESVGQGLLCMFVPLYIFYFAFAKYQSPKKGLVLGGWLGGQVVGIALMVVGTIVAAGQVAAAIDEEMGQLPAMGVEPGAAADFGAPAAAENTNATYTCNQIASNKLCYTISPPAALLPGHQAGCVAGEWSEGESCPTEDVVATCEKDQFGEVRRFYEGVDLGNAETACTTFSGTFTRL